MTTKVYEFLAADTDIADMPSSYLNTRKGYFVVTKANKNTKFTVTS